MKKYLVGMLSVVLVVAAGCGDEQTPLTPGDPADTNFQDFSQQFDSMDQGVGLMGEMAFQSMDVILSQAPQAGGVTNLSSEFAFDQPTWDEATSTWSVSLTYNDAGTGIVFTATNTIQILQGTVPVQYPDDNTTEVKSDITMEASGENFDYTAHQNLSMKPGIDSIVRLDGNGDFDMTVTVDIQSQTGTSTCTFTSKFNTTITNVAIMDSQTATVDCPVGGSVRFSGTMSSACTGEVTGSGSRSWSVTRTWDDTGASTTDFVSGGNVWTVESPCN